MEPKTRARLLTAVVLGTAIVTFSSSTNLLGRSVVSSQGVMSHTAIAPVIRSPCRVKSQFRHSKGVVRAPTSFEATRESLAPRALGGRAVVAAQQLLDLTPANVEAVLDEVRPYLQADGGSVDFVDIDGPLIKLRLKGACSSCASSSTTMQLGIKRRLQERIAGVGEVVDVGTTEEKMEVTVENIEKILDEIRPYLVGASGGALEYAGGLEHNDIKIKISGPAAKILTVRVAIQQKIKEKFPSKMRVEIVVG